MVESGARDLEIATEKLSLLIDSAIVTVMITGNGGIAYIGRPAAKDICEAHNKSMPDDKNKTGMNHRFKPLKIFIRRGK
ncbi:hypothetical protein W03_23900 [Nitrosomonas sp. PY1]|uniref:hypothetical protein n=1 Tax=Nitrosomonas sp. PY1 TaxID=1803906 RepID=UPI001FC8C402|nr:hypothetical protein [Nitrosomonas sp. PY1]GKS70386.1 hypothetical protein W03_23900 [Nitrosomonas sp. PY1]